MPLSLRPAASPLMRQWKFATAEKYHIDGLYWFRPYDLENGFGVEGAALAATFGHRYVWFGSADHYGAGWTGGAGIRRFFSDDPGIAPATGTYAVARGDQLTVEGVIFKTVMVPWLVYNPDDANDRPFYLYINGGAGQAGVYGLERFLFSSDDLETWVPETRAFKTTSPAGQTGYHTTYRRGTGEWESYGQGGLNSSPGTAWRWTSEDGREFTREHPLAGNVGGDWGWLLAQGAPEMFIGAQRYFLSHAGITSEGGQRPAFIPVDALGDPDIQDEATDIIPLTARHSGDYPGPTYIQGVTGYTEDGVYHAYITRCFFSDTNLVNGALYEDGGGFDDQYVDYYTYVYDATAAAAAAPVGVRAKSFAGKARVEWYDALPNQTYRVHRSNAADGEWTLVADVTSGRGYTHASPPQDQVVFYKVTTLDGATEEGSRIVSTYVSSASELVNRHITRALTKGADAATIDAAWLGTVETWLRDNGLLDHLLHWVDPSFGVRLASTVVEKVFDLGTTLHPRGDDLTMQSAATTYSATGLNGTPAFTGSTTGAYGAFSASTTKYNQIRRAHQFTVAAAHSKAHADAVHLLGYWYIRGFLLTHAAGSPGSATFNIAGAISTKAFVGSGPRVACGVFDGTNALVYADGEAGTPIAAPQGPAIAWGESGGLADSENLPRTLLVGAHGPFNRADDIYEPASAANFSSGASVVFTTGLTAGQIASLTTLLQTRMGV